MSVSRQLILLLFLAVAGGLGYMVYLERPGGDERAEGGPPRPLRAATAVEVATAATRVLERSIEAVGTTQAVQSVDIVPLVDGRIVELNITPGAEVAKGDVIARLDPAIEDGDAGGGGGHGQERSRRAGAVRHVAPIQRVHRQPGRRRDPARRARRRRGRRAARAAALADRTIIAPFAGVLGSAPSISARGWKRPWC